MSQRVSIWTDGACSGNPGPGGWGAVLRYGGHEKELKGGEAFTTNNRMELTAAIEALQSLNRACEVSLHTDSQYLRGGVTGWIDAWKPTAGGRRPENQSRTRTSGVGSTRPPSGTRSSGSGSKATRRTK